MCKAGNAARVEAAQAVLPTPALPGTAFTLVRRKAEAAAFFSLRERCQERTLLRTPQPPTDWMVLNSIGCLGLRILHCNFFFGQG